MPSTTVEKIYPAMSAVMGEIDAIGKESRNQQQGFMFRGIDQAYNAIHPLMAKHKIFTVPRVTEFVSRTERTTARGGTLFCTVLMVEYDFICGTDGSKITIGPIAGEAMDSGDKGCNKALAVAHKYALFQAFMIPTEKSDDPDFDTHEVAPEGTPPAEPKAVGTAAEFADLETPADLVPAPPATETAPTPPVPAPPPPAPVAADMSPEAEFADEEGAKQVTDILIDLAVGMHGTSKKSLIGFWKTNAKVIDKLDQEYPEQYKRVQDTFTKLKTKLQEQE